MGLTDAQWAIIEPLIPKPRRRKDRRGRPWREPREVLGGILWVLRTGDRGGFRRAVSAGIRPE